MRASLVGTVIVCTLVVWSGACTSSTTDTPVGDAGGATDAADGGAVIDGAASCSDCVTGTLTWGWSGGFTVHQDESSLATCRDFDRKRTRHDGDGGALSCTTQIGACDAGPVAVGDVQRALAAPDVVAALAAATTPLFGRDTRPVDGSVFLITRNGKSIEVGNPCDTDPACVPVPPGVDALVSVLKALDAQELAKPACDAFDE